MRLFSKTKNKYFFVFLMFVISLLGINNVFAAEGINKQISYYGVLKTSGGANVSDGSYDMVFKIYEDGSTSTALWTGTHTAANGNAVSVSNGNFNVLLGSGTGNTMTLDFNSDSYYIGVTVGADSEMTPRQRIGSAGYAFNADTVDGYNASAFPRLTATSSFATSSSDTVMSITQSGSGDILNILDGSTEVFTILDGGNIGIGSSTPMNIFSVSGDSYLDGGLTVTGSLTLNSVDYTFPSTDGSSGFVLTTNGSGVLSWAAQSGGAGGGTDGNWSFFNGSGIRLATTSNQVLIGGSATSSTQALEVTGGAYISSNLGVGTISPSTTLDVTGDSSFSATSTFAKGINISSASPDVTTNTLYNSSGTLYWNGSEIGLGANNLTFMSNYGVTNLTPTSTMPIWARGALYASSTATIAGNTNIGGTLDVTGKTTLGYASSTQFTSLNNAYFNATSTFAKGLSITSASPDVTTNTLYNSSGTLYWNGSAIDTSTSNWSFMTNYGVTNLTPTSTMPIWARGALYASSTATIAGNTDIGGTLDVTGKTTLTNASSTNQDLSGYLLVSGQTTLGNASTTQLSISGQSWLTGVSNISKASTTQLTVTDKAWFEGSNIEVSNIIYFNESTDSLLSINYPDTTYDRKVRFTAGKSNTATNDEGASVDLFGVNHATYAGNLHAMAGLNGSVRILTGTSALEEQIIITSEGNVGVGTSNPKTKMHLADSSLRFSFTTGTLEKQDFVFTNNNDSIALSAWNEITNAETRKLVTFAHDGHVNILNNLAIGTTTTPSYRLDVFRTGDGDVARFTDDTGACTINPTNSALICSSDARKKKDITTIDNSLDKILDLRGVNFKWNKQKNEKNHIGFIAQEVQEVIPEMVQEGPDGNLSVGYSQLIPILTNAIKELYNKVQSLTDEEIIVKETKKQEKDIEEIVEEEEPEPEVVEIIKEVIVPTTIIQESNTIHSGLAEIKSHDKQVDIVFENELENTPIVSATNNTDIDLLSNNFSYSVFNVSTKGFSIKIKPTQSIDTLFSWQAIENNSIKIFSSDETINDYQLTESFWNDYADYYNRVGCTDNTAVNYLPGAIEDDGSCDYSIAKNDVTPNDDLIVEETPAKDIPQEEKKEEEQNEEEQNNEENDDTTKSTETNTTEGNNKEDNTGEEEQKDEEAEQEEIINEETTEEVVE